MRPRRRHGATREAQPPGPASGGHEPLSDERLRRGSRRACPRASSISPWSSRSQPSTRTFAPSGTSATAVSPTNRRTSTRSAPRASRAGVRARRLAPRATDLAPAFTSQTVSTVPRLLVPPGKDHLDDVGRRTWVQATPRSSRGGAVLRARHRQRPSRSCAPRRPWPANPRLSSIHRAPLRSRRACAVIWELAPRTAWRAFRRAPWRASLVPNDGEPPRRFLDATHRGATACTAEAPPFGDELEADGVCSIVGGGGAFKGGSSRMPQAAPQATPQAGRATARTRLTSSQASWRLLRPWREARLRCRACRCPASSGRRSASGARPCSRTPSRAEACRRP